MLFLSTQFHDKNLFSVRTGGRIGVIDKPVINPNNLHIDAFECTDARNNILILLDIHIRDFSPKGIIIDDPADLSEEEDLVRLKPIISLNFSLIGKTVISSNKKIGKVVDYASDKDSLFIQKLYVNPPVWSAISKPQLIVDRQSIIEITDSKIIISGPEERNFISERNSATATG
ncbi:hypothetical protein KA043_03680 [Candidatus Saccharibacteria bacterium]|nr:hypothetical protein [Candidatus Saccharibacteria bacterium]